jgi:hypothetical protein
MFVTLLTLSLAAPPAADANPYRLEWRQREDEPHRAYLFVNGRQAGGYDCERNEWRTFNPDLKLWGEPQALFSALSEPVAGLVPNFGVIRERLNGSISHHWLNGRHVSEAEALAALRGELTDDSQKTRLTVIGSDAERQAVLADLEKHPALHAVRDLVMVQSYDPRHWAVADAGFRVNGRPTIYLQAPSGRVLHRQDEYRGPDKLAEAIRRADPLYQPDKDPDLNKPNPPSLPSSPYAPQIPNWGWCLVGAGLAFVTLRRRKSS